ncbi:23S rRNA maturation-related 3'-5' exoribonuclease YhaM [Phyllobacterium trifolii]|uniref:23S rRNA maturation-related 3'-5' exoribonuclease YhaM n=1 Tax=Phyllobacterium trifolii TaxID=300193 RepID=A0A839UFY9_9HYPH|nr:HD domain-containing protein [Phyllobacterium trifolii]MBB3149477.1 23S rRNA maturation-related 3'-5' exoribonuclease YhaM [Phyllobacterium trifolii]
MTYHYAQLRRPITAQTRQTVVEDFPEISLIPDDDLRVKVVEAWSYALCCSDFQRITDIPPEGNPGAPVLRQGTQADHIRGVLRYAKAIGLEFETAYPETAIDWNILLAGAACHDVGKPYEFDPANRARWAQSPADAGSPTFRHSVFGMHVCLMTGLPEEVAHIAVGHSFEGLHMGVSAECTIVRQADHGWWHIAGALGLVTAESVGAISGNLRARIIK